MIQVASAVVFVRVALEVAVVEPALLRDRQLAENEFEGREIGGEASHVYLPLQTGLTRLKKEELSAELDEPSWNFTKYVVGRDGRVIARFGPRTAPDSPRLRDTIDRALAAAD